MTDAPTVWCVQFVARPGAKADGPDGVVGAYVNCWVRREDRDEAVRFACDQVDASGWTVEEMEFVDEVRTRDLSAEARGYYDQALADGDVLVFFSWTEEEEAEQRAEATATAADDHDSL